MGERSLLESYMRAEGGLSACILPVVGFTPEFTSTANKPPTRGIVPGVVGRSGFGSGRKEPMPVSLLLIRGRNTFDNGGFAWESFSKKHSKISCLFQFLHFSFFDFYIGSPPHHREIRNLTQEWDFSQLVFLHSSLHQFLHPLIFQTRTFVLSRTQLFGTLTLLFW